MVDVHLGGGGTHERRILAAMRRFRVKSGLRGMVIGGNQCPKIQKIRATLIWNDPGIGTSKGTFKEPWRDTVEGDVKRLQHRGRDRPEAESSNNR
ncbi:hypothetical protein CK219_22085 [Mesorhizobium sp. WSM4313]|nr:hypothetical protein CK219_22085 [Mesorhizobium sp. WSM4313]